MFPWFHEIVTGVPAHERYLRLDELDSSIDRLAAEHPETEVWSPGASRAGRRIRCLEIEAPPIRALVPCQVASLLLALVATRDRLRPGRQRSFGSRTAP